MSTQAPTLRIDSAPSGTQFLIEHEGDTEYVMARLLEPKRMARIVTCVNSHEALIEALREIRSYLGNTARRALGPNVDADDILQAIDAVAEAALLQAEERA